MKKFYFSGTFLLLSAVLFAGCQQQPSELQNQMTDDTASMEEHADSVGELTIQEANETMVGEWVTYGDGFRGYLVKPEEPGNYPGVIMIHEWWGLNQNIKNMAHQLSGEGYIVLAVDLYDGRVAEVSDDAGMYATEVRENPDRALENMKAAAEFLKEQDGYSGKIASMGWCFGGGESLQLALNDQLDATVIYYGSLETDQDKLSRIDWPVLGVFGAEDTSIPVESVNTFESSLDALNIENEIYIYDGVGHAFANPSNAGHDPKKTADAWDKTVDFLNRHLQ